MTDEELADVLCAAYDRAKPPSWLDEADDDPEHRFPPRVKERWLATVRDVRRRLESSQREQTAATVLAALIQGVDRALGEAGIDATEFAKSHAKAMVERDLVESAVRYTDLLRAELAKPHGAVVKLEAAINEAAARMDQASHDEDAGRITRAERDNLRNNYGSKIHGLRQAISILGGGT